MKFSTNLVARVISNECSAFEGCLIGHAFYQWVMRYTLECTSAPAMSVDLRPSALTSPQRLTIIGTLSFVLGEAIGATLNFLGVDVDRSYRMARTYCDRREWVHPSTSVEASYARITGALLGLSKSANRFLCLLHHI